MNKEIRFNDVIMERLYRDMIKEGITSNKAEEKILKAFKEYDEGGEDE